MKNLYQPVEVKILAIHNETNDSKLLTLSCPRGFKFKIGQFVMVSLPGFGEAPISICGGRAEAPIKNFQICVRRVGLLTTAVHRLKKGDLIGIRGPYGSSFPAKLAKKRNLLIIVGGLGLEPVRPLISEVCRFPKKFKKVQLFYGAKSQTDLLFKDEYCLWEKCIDFCLSLDQPPKFRGIAACQIGVVTKLFDCYSPLQNAAAFLCGPPIMYKFVLQKLAEAGFKDEDIYLSLERRMDCGVGTCQHCVVGPYYVCKEGPVFSYDKIKNIAGAI